VFDAKEYVRISGNIPSELHRWVMVECERREAALGRNVVFGEVLRDALTLLQKDSPWRDEVPQRQHSQQRARRAAKAARDANQEELHYPCGECRVNTGKGNLDGRWLCDDCRRKGEAVLAQEASI
jgi:hypothetical protein